MKTRGQVNSKKFNNKREKELGEEEDEKDDRERTVGPYYWKQYPLRQFRKSLEVHDFKKPKNFRISKQNMEHGE